MVGWFFTMIIYWHHVVRLPVTHPWLCSAVIACADIVSRITEAIAKSPKAMAKLQPWTSVDNVVFLSTLVFMFCLFCVVMVFCHSKLVHGCQTTVHCWLFEPWLSESSCIWTDQSLSFTLNFVIILQYGGHLVVCSWTSCYSLFLGADELWWSIHNAIANDRNTQRL